MAAFSFPKFCSNSFDNTKIREINVDLFQGSKEEKVHFTYRISFLSRVGC